MAHIKEIQKTMHQGMYAHAWCVLSHFIPVQLFATLWIIAHQASLSMGFSRQEHYSGLPCPPPGDLFDPGIKPSTLAAPALQADSLPLSHWGSPLRSSGQILCRLSLHWDLSGVLMIRLRLQV